MVFQATIAEIIRLELGEWMGKGEEGGAQAVGWREGLGGCYRPDNQGISVTSGDVDSARQKRVSEWRQVLCWYRSGNCSKDWGWWWCEISTSTIEVYQDAYINDFQKQANSDA
ncbi:hypothetical protein ACET3Z_021312 [Daucus carota]